MGIYRLRLEYKAPFDFKGLLYFYRAHAMGKLEWFDLNDEGEDRMHRIFAFGDVKNGDIGELTIENDRSSSALLIKANLPTASQKKFVTERLRAMFDLDSDPAIIAKAIGTDAALKRMLKNHRGIRAPSGWDPFEISIATILGQLVSVDRGRTLVGDLMAELGHEIRPGVHLFPSPATIANADLTFLKTTRIRKETLKGFSAAVASGEISLDPEQDIDSFTKKILSVKGIGRWTADYMALKVLRHKDSFPATDLILARALELHPAETLAGAKPWRGYVAALLWREYAGKLTKTKTAKKSKTATKATKR